MGAINFHCLNGMSTVSYRHNDGYQTIYTHIIHTHITYRENLDPSHLPPKWHFLAPEHMIYVYILTAYHVPKSMNYQKPTVWLWGLGITAGRIPCFHDLIHIYTYIIYYIHTYIIYIYVYIYIYIYIYIYYINPILGVETARARKRFQHPLLIMSHPATMTQDAQTTIPPCKDSNVHSWLHYIVYVTSYNIYIINIYNICIYIMFIYTYILHSSCFTKSYASCINLGIFIYRDIQNLIHNCYLIIRIYV